jgi:hypothetical protein
VGRIPLDRDNALSSYGGLVGWMARLDAPQLVPFTADYRFADSPACRQRWTPGYSRVSSARSGIPSLRHCSVGSPTPPLPAPSRSCQPRTTSS